MVWHLQVEQIYYAEGKRIGFWLFTVRKSSAMQPLTSIERIDNTLHRQPVDRIGRFEHFRGGTLIECWRANRRRQR